ncbi:SNARE associated Golgi protein-related protein [uncultured Paludibacter sp.]|nr:SNARE associated Golgi protein-related protein [uncultured Paludibacter sp.]
MKKTILILSAVFLLAIPHISAQTAVSQQPDSTRTLFQKIEHWYKNNMNYGTITLLMAIESSFVPLPSEIVIPPAAYIASEPDSKLNIVLIIFFGTLGALLGATFNYFLAFFLGRPLVYKFAESKVGKLFLLSEEKIRKSETYFNNKGKISTFIGRLIPGIRHLISIPAGLARMNYGAFALFTVLGAFIWNVCLALMGYFAHGQADLINKYSHEFSIIIVVLVGLAVVYYALKFFIKRKKTDNQ